MLPHQKQFNIIEFFELIIDYSMKLPNQSFQSIILEGINDSQQRSEILNIESQQQQLILKKGISIDKVHLKNMAVEVKQKKINYAEEILDKLKNVFLWYRKKTISYEMINNYVLSCQNRTLKDKNALQNLTEYQNLPHRRVRLDENVKLCIMPQGDSSKIKSLSINPIQENNEDIFHKDLFVITSEYIRSIHVDSDKLAKEGNKTIKVKDNENAESNKINIVKNWYTYNEEKIIPESKEDNEKSMKINAKKQLYIEKVAMSQHLIGIVTHEKEVLIKPFLSEDEKYQRGRRIVPYQIRLGNLVQDIPDQNLQRPISQDKAKANQIEKSKLLMFECYNDDIWIAVNEYFVYVYILPLPDSNQSVNDQQPKSRMLALCEPLPSRAHQAKLLTKQYLAIMLETPCVIILKLQLSSKQQLREKNRIYPTNKIYNDIKFICMDYHPVDKQLIFTDFGSYLIRLRFNIADGDVEREGAVYDEETGKIITENTTNTRRQKQFNVLKKQSEINIQSNLLTHFSQVQIEKMTLKQSKQRIPQNPKQDSLTVWQNKGTSISNISSGGQIHISKQKQSTSNLHSNDKGGMSIYSKPQNTDYMKIVKNSSRQNMILLCLNKNTSTLITYEEMSVNPLKNGKQDEESDKDRLYDKTIRLWDMNHMNVYQTFTLSLQIAHLSLQSNGLYIVTKERGYLGFYPLLNKEQNAQVKKKTKNITLSSEKKQIKPIFNDKVVISGNEIFFYTQLQKQRNYTKIYKQGYQNHLINYNNPVTTIYSLSISNQQHSIINLQEIPAEIAELQARNKLYVLSDTSGDKKFNLHIYDMLGNKECLLKGTDRTRKYGILQNYTRLQKINHFQFNVLLWNKHSLKFVGSNLEESFTIHWTFSCQQKLSTHQKSTGSEFDLRSLKSSVSRREKQIQDICISQNSISIQEKLQNDLYRFVALSILHLGSGRIKYRVNDIRSSFNVLEVVNNMILARENIYQRSMTSTEPQEIETSRKSSFNRSHRFQNRSNISYPVNQDEQLVNLFDLNSPFYRKCLFTIKYKTLKEQNMTLQEIQPFKMEFNNVITHERFFKQKSISLKSARLFALNNDSSLVIALIFMIKTQCLYKNPNQHNAIQKDKVFHCKSKYVLYTRQISSQIAQKMKYIPHTTDSNIKKVSKKAMSQYMGETQVNQRILTHYEIDCDQLINRSTIKNLSYSCDLHSDSDEGIQFIIQDVTQKLIEFSQNSTHHHKHVLLPNQNILQLYETNSYKESSNCIDLNWVLAEAQSPKSIIKLSSTKFFELHSLKISFDMNQKQLLVNLEKICQIALDDRTQQPFVKEWNTEFNSQSKQIWEETKSSMVEYIKHKLSKQTQKHLNSPSNLSKRNSKYCDKSMNFLTLTEAEAQQNPQQNIQQEVPSPVDSPSKSHFNSNQLNNMFRQWHINKNIQKQMKEYEKNTTEAQKQLHNQLKHIIQNPEIQQKRIKYLLEFPQKIKDHRLGTAMDLISKNLKLQNSMNKIFSMISLKSSQKGTKQVMQAEKKKRKSDDDSLDKKVQISLQKLEMSLSLPKIISNNDHKSTKSAFGSSKMSQLKQTKKSSQNQIDPRIHSSLSSDTNELSSPLKTDARSQSLKTSKNVPTTKTKTEVSERNYLQSITEIPLEFYQNSRKHKTNQKLRDLPSPNPESSLSNIYISNPRQKESPAASFNVSNIIAQSPIMSNSNTIEVKKSKSILTRAKTQVSHEDEQIITKVSNNALMQLKQSSITINKSILPQIKMNREKLNEKMKEKKSFLKAVNQRLCFTKEEIKEELLKNNRRFERLETFQ